MRIPKTTKKPRWYVAVSLEEAYSSWGSLLEAHASIGRFAEDDPLRRNIRGIVENGPRGPHFVFLTRFPVNEHDVWIDNVSEKPLLLSEIVRMARRQLATRDRWLKEMPTVPEWRQEDRGRILVEYEEIYSLAEKVLAEHGALFPAELEN